MNSPPVNPSHAPPAASWWSRHQLQIVPWLFLAPALAMFMVYVIAPIFESIVISFYAIFSITLFQSDDCGR